MLTTYTSQEIAAKVSGVLIGSPSIVVSGIASLDEPREGALSFSKDTSKKKLGALFEKSRAPLMLLSKRIQPSHIPAERTVILVEDPLLAMVDLIPLFYHSPQQSTGVHRTAVVGSSTTLGTGISIGAYAVIGESCTIGRDVTIYPHVVVYDGCTIGNGCVLHAGAIVREGSILGDRTILQNGVVIGADGFGYAGTKGPHGEPVIRKVPQVGIVRIANDVEIGAHSCIDRAALGTTVIGPHTKIDNLVQVGHNTKIGGYSIICGQTAIAGSTTIGNGVTLGGSVGVRDHVSIADGVRVAARAGVIENLTVKGDYAGFPAVPVFRWRRQIKALSDLTKNADDVLTESDDESKS
jgi:UDP-3-O-[3-hydroxymyristoyl] glucosamine N-acyltransferase